VTGTGAAGPWLPAAAVRVLGDVPLVNHHCHSLLASWRRTDGGQWPD